jgi:hypothetical protein
MHGFVHRCFHFWLVFNGCIEARGVFSVKGIRRPISRLYQVQGEAKSQPKVCIGLYTITVNGFSNCQARVWRRTLFSMERQFIFTHGFLINRANINCAQLLSGGTMNNVNVIFGDGVTITIKAKDEKDAIETMRLLEHGE